MLIRYVLHSEQRLIAVCIKGQLSLPALRDCVRCYRQAPAYHEGMDVLFVLDESAVLPFDEFDVAAEITSMVRAGRSANVYRVACAGGMISERTIFGVFFEIVNPRARRGLFDDVGEALRWLGANVVEGDLLRGAKPCSS